MTDRRRYHQKYYRMRTIAKLTVRVQRLEYLLKTMRESPEGQAYLDRKTREYQKVYRINNKKKLKEYREQYATL